MCAAAAGALSLSTAMSAEEETFEYLTVKDGKVLVVKKEGEPVVLKEPYTFKDGTTIVVSGEYTRPDKTVATLKEGEKLSSAGKLTTGAQ
jgi:hypothetical protein